MKKFIVITTGIILMVIYLTSCSSSAVKSGSAPEKSENQTSSVPETKPAASSEAVSAPKPLDTAGQAGRQIFEDVFVRKDNWIYTCPFFTYLPVGIYQAKSVDSIKRSDIICKDKAGSINVIGGQVYYVNGSDGNKIYTIKTNRTDKRKLLDMNAGYLYIIDNTMFFTDVSVDKSKNIKSWLYMAKTDGSQLKCINPQYTTDIYIEDGWIYFLEGKWGGSAIMFNDVCKMRIDGTGKKVITKKKVWNIRVSGDWIYYNDMYSENVSYLYKMKKDGTQITKITNDNVLYKVNDHTNLFNWKIFENWIYYTNAQDGGKLYRISLSGTDRKKLDDEKCTAVFLADESNFTHVLIMYKLNSSQGTYKDFHINNDTGEIINGIITK